MVVAAVVEDGEEGDTGRDLDKILDVDVTTVYCYYLDSNMDMQMLEKSVHVE